jgi:hypothetical protein
MPDSDDMVDLGGFLGARRSGKARAAILRPKHPSSYIRLRGIADGDP